jgi:hypothetical protein
MTISVAEYVSGEKTHVGTSKVEHYRWTMKDSRGTYMALDKNELFVDHAYQRDQNEKKVIEMARSWSWMACGAVLVALRQDGTHFVFDGQHRVMAARKRSDITTLDCLVFEVDELHDEADGFLKSNTLRKPVPMMAKFKALIVCNDRHAVAVSKLLESVGLTVDKQSRPGSFNSLAWAVKAHSRNEKTFEQTLRLAAQLAGNKHYVHESMCRGLFQLDIKHQALSNQKFVRRILQVGYQDIFEGIHRAVAYYKKGGDKVWSQGILDTVNHGLRNRFYVEQIEGGTAE